MGACANAPMAQIGKDYYEDLTPAKLRDLIGRFSKGEVPVPGPQNGRYAAEPLSGLTSLKTTQSGRRQYNASAQAAVDLADTVRRIDGSEMPLTMPWLGTPVGPVAKANAIQKEPEPGRGLPADASGVTVQEASAQSKGKPKSDGNAANATPLATPEAKSPPMTAQSRPQGLSAARADRPDDLKLIVGIGPKLEILCNKLGFFHFDQLAAWTDAEIAWADDNLEGFKGRASRDKWVDQARILAAGGKL